MFAICAMSGIESVLQSKCAFFQVRSERTAFAFVAINCAFFFCIFCLITGAS